MTLSAQDSLADHMEAGRSRVDAALFRYTEFGKGCPPRLQAAVRHSLLAPGKRLRPLLVLMAAEACGQTEGDGVIAAACAVEMVHAYSLIHDDLPAMDDDDLRRGRPTCHMAFDEATAILAGDALLARAIEVLAEGVRPVEVAARCCGELAGAAGATALVGGQMDDLTAVDAPRTMELLEAIHRRKTGAIIRVSLRLGGLVAGGAEEQIKALDDFGGCLGLAFQIVDDLLDAAGNEKVMGKQANKDAGRGKLTFPLLLGEEESRRRARRLIDEAICYLTTFGSGAARLEELARYVLDRNH